MNAEDFKKELMAKTGITEEQCTIVNNVLENTVMAGKESKELIIGQISEKLNVSEKQAEVIYGVAMGLLAKGAVHKVKGHFKKKNKSK